MDEIERQVADRLVAGVAYLEPPPDLGSRILSGATARRRRQRLMRLGGVSLVVAVLVGSLYLVWPVALPPAPPVASLDELIGGRETVTIARELPDGAVFDALAMSESGTVIGRANQVGPDLVEHRRDGVWVADPRTGATSLLHDATDTSAFWTAAVSDQVYLWPDREYLRCLPAGTQGEVMGLPGWSGRDPFFAGGGLIVWGGSGGAVLAAEDCGGTQRRTLQVRGRLVAFSYPHAFIISGGDLDQIDLLTGAVVAVRGVPASARNAASDASVAVNQTVVAVGNRDGLTMIDRGTGSVRASVARVPHRGDIDFFHRVSAGTRFIVFSVFHQDRDITAAVVYDLRSGLVTELPGEAWAAGDFLLWRDGGVYRLLRT